MTSTRDRILDVAEVLFAQRGFDGTSLREITRQADVNLGAVNYHFGSKSELFSEVLQRRFEPMNRRRIDLLEAAIARDAPEPPPLEDMLEAYLRPPVEAFSSPARATLLGVMHQINEGTLDPEQFAKIFSEVHGRFAMIREHLEDISDVEFRGRMRFLVGGMIHLLADRGWRGSDLDVDTIVQMLVIWGSGLMRAPSALVAEDAQ